MMAGSPTNLGSRKICRRRFLELLAAGAAMASTPYTLARTRAEAASPVRGGKLTWAHTLDVLTFFPGNLNTGNWPMFNSVYDPILRLDGSLSPHPWLAESWQFSNGGKDLKLNLRKDVRFHSGREFTAPDVTFSIEYYRDPANGANIRTLTKLVTGMKVLDPHTLVLHFDAPNPGIFDMLDLLFIIDKDTAADIKNKGVGTGPFKLAEWVPGDRVRLVRNEQYWRPGEPYLDEIILQVQPSLQSMAGSLEAGKVDVVDNPTVQDYVRLTKGPRFQGIKIPSPAVNNVIMNVKSPKLSNKYVRQAINHAIDRKRFVEIAYQGLTQPACQPITPQSWAYAPDLEPMCKFDLNRAKALLARGGAAKGLELQTIVGTSTMPTGGILAQIMRDDLAKIGVKLTIRDLEAALYDSIEYQGRYKDIYIQFFGRDRRDPAALFGSTVAFRPDGNISQFDSAGYAKLIKAAASTLDRSKRKPLYHQIEEILVDECFSLTIAPHVDLFLLGAKVKNMKFNVDNMAYLGQVWFAS